MAEVDKAGELHAAAITTELMEGKEQATHGWSGQDPRPLRPGSTVDVTHGPITGRRLHCWMSVLALAQVSMYNSVQHNDIQSG
jgi:hypothetical protein